ncbi:hypothetical protein HDU96_009509 [Phlyctochytrium bullatum]|nr:hypothetical protein HDU96_009509 [Phlyctochytrium bullatum]
MRAAIILAAAFAVVANAAYLPPDEPAYQNDAPATKVATKIPNTSLVIPTDTATTSTAVAVTASTTTPCSTSTLATTTKAVATYGGDASASLPSTTKTAVVPVATQPPAYGGDSGKTTTTAVTPSSTKVPTTETVKPLPPYPTEYNPDEDVCVEWEDDVTYDDDSTTKKPTTPSTPSTPKTTDDEDCEEDDKKPVEDEDCEDEDEKKKPTTDDEDCEEEEEEIPECDDDEDEKKKPTDDDEDCEEETSTTSTKVVPVTKTPTVTPTATPYSNTKIAATTRPYAYVPTYAAEVPAVPTTEKKNIVQSGAGRAAGMTVASLASVVAAFFFF